MPPTKQDDETAKDSMTPDFLKGIDISPEEEKEMEDAAYSGAADDIAAREGLSGDELKTAEENPSSGTATTAVDPKEGYKAGFGYRDEDKGKKKAKKKGSFLKRNQKWFIGGGLGSGIAGLILSFMLLLPLKVQHMVNNLQSHFFASTEKATQDMTDKLFTQYIVHKVIPGMYASNKCTTTKVNSSCVAVTPGDGPIARLYNAWRDNNLEGKLAENQGLEIRREGNKFYLRKGNSTLFSGVYDEKNPKLFENKMYSEMNRAEVRREVRKSFENETFAKRILYRYKVGKLLERKYSVKRCLVACTTRDKLQTRKDAREARKELRKLKWKAYFIDRIVTPRNEMLSIAMKCAIGGFSCTAPGPADEDGERSSEFERETRTMIRDRLASGDVDSKERLSQLDDEAKSIRENGLTNHIIKKLTNQLIADFSTKAVPILGQLQLAAQLNKGLNELGPALKKLNYVINSETMVTMYMMYRTNADEIKTGEADAADIGIVANSLGPDTGTDQGGASAEEAPIYNDIMGGSSVKQASIFTGFVPKANASSGYQCNDGSKISSGVCPELLLNSVGFLTNAAGITTKLYSSIESVPLPSGLSANQTVDIWLATGGKVFDLAGGLIGHITDGVLSIAKHTPGLGSAIGYLEDKSADLFKILATWFSKLFINDIIGNSPSGGRNFEIAAGGADVAGNNFAHYGLGGHRISDQAAAEIRIAMKAQEKSDFEHQSMFARMFDTSSQYSLVSKLAVAMPTTSVSGTTRSMASSLLNPFASVTTQFSGSKKTEAASTKDPYGVSQYGYSPDEPVFKSDDLQDFWDKNGCSSPDRAKQWGDAEAGNINPDTYMPENDVANPCKLIDTAVGAAGGIYDPTLLGDDAPQNSADTSNQGGGSSFRISSFNIFYANGGGKNGGDWSARLDKSVSVINEKHLDVVGLQEVQDVQWQAIQKRLDGNYAIYPQKYSYEPGSNSIIWRNDKFDLVKGDAIPARGVHNQESTTSQVLLKDRSTGQQFYVINTHEPVGNGPPDGDGGRYQNDLRWKAYINNLQGQNIPIFFTGDFNAAYGEGFNNNFKDNDKNNGIYCILTADGTMWDSYDASKNIPGKCPTNSFEGLRGGDHIFMSREVTASSHIRTGYGFSVNGSDTHQTIISDVTIPGSGPTASNTTTVGSACYTVTKLSGSKIEGKMLHKEDNTPINTYAKENSPQGIKYAAAHNYDSIDLDVQITKDGVPINTHWGQPMAKDGFYDPLHKLPESTQVSDMTLAEVTRLRNKDGQSQIYSLQDQIKLLASNNVNLSLELKTGALVKTFPQITTWLNEAGVKAYMKADASRPALNNALTKARGFGYWTRGTLGTQDWKAPQPDCAPQP